MASNTWTSKIYNGLTIIYHCAILNFLFLTGCILGLGIFGIGPSLYASFNLAKRYHQHTLVQPFRSFIKIYCSQFLKANMMLLPIIIVLFFIRWNTVLFYDYLTIPILLIMSFIQLVLLLLVVYAFTLTQFYELSPMIALKKGFQFTFFNSLGSILTILWTAICYYGSLLFPGVILFFSVGLWLTVTMGIHLRLFEINEQQLEEEEKRNGYEVVKSTKYQY